MTDSKMTSLMDDSVFVSVMHVWKVHMGMDQACVSMLVSMSCTARHRRIVGMLVMHIVDMLVFMFQRLMNMFVDVVLT